MPTRSVIADFRTSKDVIENSTRHGNNASDGRVLSMNPGSEIETTLEILRPSNYSIGLRANTCESCTFLRIELEGNNYHENFTVFTNRSNGIAKHDTTGLQWLNSNTTFLKQGTYKFKIHSDSQADLDSVVIYPSDNRYSSASNGAVDIFNHDSSPAQISGYEKINPTKHILIIKNATRPYIISFAESYDALWTAYSNNDNNEKNNYFKTNSIPLYGITNGFYVNKTGDYELIIEYEPQNWFVLGSIISISSIILLLAITILLVKKKYLRVTYRKYRKILKQGKN